MKTRQKVIIIGAGLTGSLLAIFLSRRNYDVDVYEKRSDIKKSPADTKRTIAMSISYRGWKALEQVNLASVLKALSTPTYGRITFDSLGENYKQYYGDEDQAIYTINRKILNTYLIDCADSFDNCNFYFDQNLQSINFDEKTIVVENNGNSKACHYDYLFATDGVFSKCREEYEKFLKIPPQIEKLSIGYKEFTIPYEIVDKLNWDRSFVHVWPAGSANFVALPSNNKNAFMGNLFCSNDWVDFFNSSPAKKEIIRFLNPKFPLLTNVLENMDDSSFTEPSANIYTTKSQYWNYCDNFLLLGDAIHGMAPFYAMGMNICFEDCVMFEELLSQVNGNLSQTIESFQHYRKKDVDAMQKMALENFQNLSQSSEIWFDQEWRLDSLLSQYCPEHWASESALVSFHGIPISEIELRIDRQKKFIAEHKLSYDLLKSKTKSDIEDLCYQIKETIPPYIGSGAIVL